MKNLAVLALASACGLAATPVASVSTVPASYDFGTVKQGETVRRVFAVKNSGAEPVRLARVDFELPGMRARFKPLVPAGGEGSLEVEWATGHLAGAIETAAVVGVEGGAALRIPLKIRVTPPIEIRPLSQVFLSAFEGERAERVLTIENHTESPMTPSVEGGGGRVETSLATLTAGRTFELTVRPAPGVKPGRYEETLTLAAKKDGPPASRIPVHLFVKADLYANPEEVDFGPVPAGPAAAGLVETFLVKRREGAFRITSVSCPEPAVKAELSPDGPSGTFQVDVRLAPAALARGRLETKLRIATDDPRFPEISVPVRADVR